MKLVKIESEGRSAEGVLDGETVRLVGGWIDGPADRAPFSLSYRTVAEIEALLAQSSEAVALSAVALAVPVDPFRKIICAGVNYRDHAGEIKADEPQNPILFTRSLDSLVPAGAAILKPSISETFDYEGEIAVVVGRDGRHIPVGEALSYVSGYTCFLDGSVREYQRHAVSTGKNFWRSGSMGPWVVPGDEIGDTDIALKTRLNGQVVQSTRLGAMIFGIAELISYCSRWTWLRPGDVISTGTPGGVGSRCTPPLWMKPGDTIEVEVEKVGLLSNPVGADD